MRVPKLIFPVLVFVALLGGYFLRTAFTQPTTNIAYDTKTGTQAVFIVDGLKCKGTAGFFTSLYENTPGIIGIETFATEHKAVVTYDPEQISPDGIKQVMEQEILFEDGTSEQVFKCLSME
ncbi:MAG TPA: heavy-metal-associated domain-containing protein [candidate division Zixibacteria bacterium]|nr:heavy-metal-associated domain-containing protein [candidate division Zixibacteria bacterium]